MAGLIVTIGGRMDATYEAALVRSVALAKASAIQIQSEYARAQMMTSGASFKNFNSLTSRGRAASSTVVNKNEIKTEAEQYGLWWKESMETEEEKKLQSEIAAASRRISVSRRWRSRQENRANRAANAEVQGPDLSGAMRASADEEKLKDDISAASRRLDVGRRWRARQQSRKDKVAAAANEIADAKSEQLAMLTVVARQGGIGAGSGAGHRYGGKGGVIQEIAVIGHEMLQGRGTGRIIGSISILAGRLGWLGKLVKSTAQEEIYAAFAENKLAGAMARTALEAEKKAVATIAAGEASGLSKGAALQAAGADLAAAAAARTAGVAQTAKAAATVEAAEIAAASATTALGPIGWLLLAVIAVAGIFFLLVRSMNRYAKEQRALNETLATSATKFSDESSAMEKANAAAIEFEKSLAKLNLRHNQSVEKSDLAIEALKRHADATANLAEEKRKAAMLDIDLAEKQGKIGHIQAIRARADAEKQAVSDKAATQIAAMKAEVDQRAADSIKGIKDATAAGAADKEANDALNKSPESIARMAAVDFAKRKKSEADEKVKTAEKALEDEKNSMFGNENMIGVKSYALKQAKGQADFRQQNYDSAQKALTPSEISAQAASQTASEASTASDNLQKAFSKALVDYNAKVKDSPAAISAAQANISKQAKIDELGNRPGPQGLNAMQKLGAFTAQGGNPLIDIGHRHTVLLSQILAANKGLKEYQANKQGGVAY